MHCLMEHPLLPCGSCCPGLAPGSSALLWADGSPGWAQVLESRCHYRSFGAATCRHRDAGRRSEGWMVLAGWEQPWGLDFVLGTSLWS